MLTECEICMRRFDSAIQQENCPHTLTEDYRLAPNPDQIAHARALLGKKVKASFDQRGPARDVQYVSDFGMVTVAGLRGEFQPNWFYEVNPT